LVPDLVKKAAELGMPAVALTDHGTMAGIGELMKEGKKHGIKTIPGMESYVAWKSAKEPRGFENPTGHLILLARNNEGYRNLCALVEWSNLYGHSYAPRIDMEILAAHSRGLIGLTACVGGYVWKDLLGWSAKKGGEKLVRDPRPELVERTVGQLRDIFDPGCFFLEVSDHRMEDPTSLVGEEAKEYGDLLWRQKKVIETAIGLSQRMDIPIVATNDLHYLDKDAADARAVCLTIRTKKSGKPTLLPRGFEGMLAVPGAEERRKDYFGLREVTGQLYLKTRQEMEEVFNGYQEFLKNTLRVAEMCEFQLEKPEGFDLPMVLPGNPISQLRNLVEEGFRERYPENPEEARERLEHEITVVDNLGFENYFLLVWDVVREAKERGILVGPGRGSAAGSILCYCLGITDLDPLRHGLPFERFLNKDRIESPDIDTDFDPERLPELIDWCVDRYGEENVAHIGTYGEMHAKSCIRKVGTAYGLSYEWLDNLTKALPKGSGEYRITLEDALTDKTSPFGKVAKEFIRSGGDMAAEMLAVASKMDGVHTHRGQHPCGLVITGSALRGKVPLVTLEKPSARKKGEGPPKMLVIEYPHKHLEILGLLKIDLLYIDGLTTVAKAMEWIRERHDPDFRIPPERETTYEDPEVFNLFSRGETLGLFQVNTHEMRMICARVQPRTLEDIATICAIFRPGPKDAIDPDTGLTMLETYLQRRAGKLPTRYDHPLLEPILRKTHGVIVFQESIMEIAQTLCGMSGTEADTLRKAVGKKLRELIEEQERKFVPMAIQHSGIDEKTAKKIWDQIVTFARYGFSLNHATAYAKLSYIQGWIKANYPLEYLAGCLYIVSSKSDTDKREGLLHLYVDECNRMGIPVLPPDVGLSSAKAKPEGNAIRLGITSISGIKKAADVILSAGVEEDDPLLPAVQKLAAAKVGPANMERLVKAGAMDRLGPREECLAVVARYKGAKKGKKKLERFFNLEPDYRWENLPDVTEEEIQEGTRSMLTLVRPERETPQPKTVYLRGLVKGLAPGGSTEVRLWIKTKNKKNGWILISLGNTLPSRGQWTSYQGSTIPVVDRE